MTELLTRPSSPPRYGVTADGATASIWWRGVLAALWAVALGVATLMVIVLVAWASDSRAGSSAGEAIRTSLQIWLAAHKVPMAVPGGTVAVAPLLLTLALTFLVARAAAVLARGHGIGDARGVATVAAAVGLPYAGFTTFVAAAAHSSSVRPGPVAALACGLVVGVLSAGWGAARGSGLVREVWALLPEPVRVPASAGAAAAAILTAAGTLLVIAGVALHVSTAADSVSALGGGAVAAVALVALDLALLPKAGVFGVGYLAGPGFAVGAGSSVTMSSAQVGTMPSLPLLAAVPHHPAPLAVMTFGVLSLVVAGGCCAWLVSRIGAPLLRSTALAAAAGGVAGFVAALAAVVAGGPAGPGAMAAVGSSPWQTGLAVAAEVAVVASGATGVLTWRRGR
ncbi:MAG TPA: DUF6350 family protein [Mycobacteriales bacterium]|nr:DUF6350 family protein [Mycobacteriales bacterium]